MFDDSLPVRKDPASLVKLVYVLYIVGFIAGLSILAGVVVAYVNRGHAEHWLESHYRFQIRTFWIGLLYVIVASVLCLVLVGFVLLLLVAVWFLVRCGKGLKYSSHNLPHPHPASWGFG